MTDVVHSTPQAWDPEQLSGKTRPPSWLTTHLETLRPKSSVDIRDQVELDAVTETSELTGSAMSSMQSISWFSDLLSNAVDRDMSIRDVLLYGRNFQVEDVLRYRALHKGDQLTPNFVWSGPEVLAGDQLVKLTNSYESLIATTGERSNEIRFRMRLQGMGLEEVLISYAATELIDPLVMDSVLSLDVLCHADFYMTSEVIRRLGLARAFKEEIELAQLESGFRGDRLWLVVQEHWQQEMLYAKTISKRWAEDIILRGRVDVGSWGVAK